jgi:hypothetical protein
MDCIENSPFPLVFKQGTDTDLNLKANQNGRRLQVGSAQPVEVTFRAKTSTDAREVLHLAHLAVASSPALNEKGEMPTSAPADTHVFIGNEEDEDKTQTLLNMGEQTCYLHAAFRSAIKTRIKIGC